MYRVGMRSAGWPTGYLFVGTVGDTGGHLRWLPLPMDRNVVVTPHVVIVYAPRYGGPFTGRVWDRDVTTAEAEQITGLYCPAALDRLRELCHESGGG